MAVICIVNLTLIYREIQGDGILEVSREQLNMFHCNLECSLGWVQTLFPKYFGQRFCQINRKEHQLLIFKWNTLFLISFLNSSQEG